MRTLAALLALGSGCAYYRTEEEEVAALYGQARHHLSTGRDPAVALAWLDRAIELAPERGEIYETRASLHRDAGRLEEARDDTVASLRLQGGRPPDLLVRLGTLEGELGFLDRAETALDEAVRREPGLVEARLQRARFRRLAGRSEEARKDVEAARAAGAGWAERFHNEGVRRLHAGRPPDAESSFRFATEIDPLRAESWMGLGRALMETGRPAPAAEAFAEAASIRRTDPEPPYHHGNALWAAGRPEEAVEAYRRAEALGPKRPAYPTGLGVVYQAEFHDPARAEAAYARALAIDADFAPALYHRASLYLELGRLEEAERDLRRSLSRRGSAEGARLLASILNEAGKYDAAINVCLEALDVFRDTPVRAGLDDELRRALARKETPK